MITLLWTLIFLACGWVLFYQRAVLSVWTISFTILMLLHSQFSSASTFTLGIEWSIFILLAITLNIVPLRQQLFSRYLLAFYKKQMPRMSATEREALEAGTVTWEGDLFQGNPNWEKLLHFAPAKLTEEEEAFLAGPVEEVCRMTNDWEVSHNLADLPPKVWQFLKTQGFFALIIPKSYGGKEFSAYAHAKILYKLYGHSIALASTVAVPNSLGPAELLLHYGTEEQKNYYLPRLAKGEEIPCFALTNPEAGSDAGSIPDYGIICKDKFNGKETLGIRLNWNKRYITLAPVATVLGLAFKLYDPDHLIGTEKDLGITCALIPANHPGVIIGRRHLPLNAMFQNGPTQGKDIFIPIDWIIGGPKMAGHGWRMLVECLSAGRAISLPSSAVGSMKVLSWATGAYAHIRKQFNLAIGHFEGIQQPLARIAGFTYIMQAAHKFTLAAIDRGEKPSIPSAIMKYHATEHARLASCDSMDIHAGKGICLGPKNYVGRGYQTAPIGITVEGANILTRNLIIFGQGVIRCHPFILPEMQAAQNPDPQKGLVDFDKAFFSHLGYSFSNVFRSFWLSLSNAHFVKAPKDVSHRYYQLLTRYSAAFSFMSDACMLIFGADLKRKENVSARLGDVLSMLYLASGVLHYYAEQNYLIEDKPLVDWSCQHLLFTIQQQLSGILENLPNKLIGDLLSFIIFPFGKKLQEPNDSLLHKVAELVLHPTATRERLTSGIYLGKENNPLYVLENGLSEVIANEPLEKKFASDLHDKKIHGYTFAEQIKNAVDSDVLTSDEGMKLTKLHDARIAVISVDDFDPNDLIRLHATKH